MNFSFHGATARSELGPSHYRGCTITDTPHSVGLLWTSGQPENTQHSQESDIYAPGGIRTHNPSKRTAANPLILRGHRDRIAFEIQNRISWMYTTNYWRKTFTLSFHPLVLAHFRRCMTAGVLNHFNGVVEAVRSVLWLTRDCPSERSGLDSWRQKIFHFPKTSTPVLGSTQLPTEWRSNVL
jgi:hypothetical protein